MLYYTITAYFLALCATFITLHYCKALRGEMEDEICEDSPVQLRGQESHNDVYGLCCCCPSGLSAQTCSQLGLLDGVRWDFELLDPAFMDFASPVRL